MLLSYKMYPSANKKGHSPLCYVLICTQKSVFCTMIYDLLCCGPQRIRYIQSLYSDLGILAFSAFPEQLFQWHDEENSSYTATALYGNLTRFHKHLAYIALNANNILIFDETVYFLFPNANIIICFC